MSLITLQTWLTHSKTNPTLATMRGPFYVVRVSMHVTEAFNGGTDRITAGWDTDNDSIFTSIDVSSTGIKSLTLGANEGYNGVGQAIEIYFTSDSTATTGKALVILEIFLVPLSP